MNEAASTDPAQVLAFAVVPPSIDVSTPANPQLFTPQFGIVNIGVAAVSIRRALLQVPVTTPGATNLASNTDMAPGAITANWVFGPATATEPGYAAFELLPNDGAGTIRPGGSIAFTLGNVHVADVPGSVALRFEAETSLGPWQTAAGMELTTPDITPTVTRYSVLAADPRKQITLQNEQVTVSWTSTGAAYCTIEDDQGNTWLDLPTSGTIHDTPAAGDAQRRFNRVAGNYYSKVYTLTAYSAGALQADQKSNAAIVRLPTIFEVSVATTALDASAPLLISWSIASIDAEHGKLTLATVPQDGSPGSTVTFKAGTASATVSAPATGTDYVLTIDNGFGVVAQATIAVPPPPPPGWTEQAGLETLQAANLNNDPGNANLAVFAGRLWCGQATLGGPLLFSTPDGSSWTSVSAHGLPSSYGRPSIDALLVADLGEGETLWAFGNAPDDYTPYVAKSADGISWEVQPRPPYPRRWYGAYAANNGCLLVMSGQIYGDPDMQQIWQSRDGKHWTQIGSAFPNDAYPVVAAFAGRLYTLDGSARWILQSADDGKSWQRQTQLDYSPGYYHTFLPLADELCMIGAGGVFTMNKGGVWTTLGGLPPDDGRFSGLLYSAALSDHIWAACVDDNGLPRFYMFNALLPGTIIASITPGPTKMAQAPTGR